ncbi:MAG: methionine--tRNA ligase [Patescibacteria group bacterium]|nr:methionine--tRNA ligase [Patescibacteria group bacterium]
MKKFYITTPIYYVNSKPHIGHAYTNFAADAAARWHRMAGADVYFLTGTDENSQKNVEAAAKEGEKDIQKFVDRMSAVWQETLDSLGMTHDDFIRTTEPRHKEAVEKFVKTVVDAGDIYQGTYEGWYCGGCEAFVTDSDLIDGKCPIHQKPVQKIKEKNYFFKLTKYRKQLLKHIKDNPDFIQPVSRRNEVVSYIKDFMEDVSITRESMEWGIKMPGDSKSVIYVWFDALINYISAIGYFNDQKKFKKYWPADVHIVGKDIIKFHCALWPAMLMSAGLELPKRIFAHGFFTVEGQKISKSLGNAVDPVELANKYGVEALRYYLLREITFGEDGVFSISRLEERYNNDLANELGNLLQRTLAMTEKYVDSKVPELAAEKIENWPLIIQAMEKLNFSEALDETWEVVREANRFIDREQPWQLAKINSERLAAVLYILLETLRNVGWMLLAVMPQTAEKIWTQLGLDPAKEKSKKFETAIKWGGLKSGTAIKKAESLFPRLNS